MLAFAIFAVTFVFALIIAIIWLYPSSKKVTTIPGLDPTSKEDGNLSDIGKAGSLHEFLCDLHIQYGDISGFWWGQMYVVSIASPKLFKAHANVFDRPPELFKLFEPLIGSTSIQYANGSDGRTRWKNYQRAFAHENLNKYYGSFQDMSGLVTKKWSKKSASDHVALMEDMFSFAIRTALLTLMGENFTDEKLVMSVNNAYSKAWSEMEHRLVDPVMPGEASSRQKSLDEAIAYLHKTVQKVIQHRQDNKLTSQKLLIDTMMESTTDENILNSDIITYMVGSFHTTANMLTWAIYFLATNPDVQDKLANEVTRVLGAQGEVSEANLGQLSYMTQVLEETLRCAVVAPWAARVNDFDTELGGHKVPKNTPVIHALGVVLQDEKLWPLPKNFDPDRFSPDNRKDIPSLAFSPFGFAGKRQCPGHKYAYLESTVLIANIVRKFKVSLWEDQVVKPVYGLVTHPMDEVWLRVTKRS